MIISAIVGAFISLIVVICFQEPVSRLFKWIVDVIKEAIKEPDNPINDNAFRFGKHKSSVIILDGDGRETYDPDNINAYLGNIEAEAESDFKTEVKFFRSLTEKELNVKKANGENVPWNGKTKSLSKYRISRSEERERMRLDLELSENEYYNTYAVITHLHDVCNDTNRKLFDYIEKFDFSEASGKYDLPNSVGVCLQVFTKDNKTIFSRRSLNCGFRQGEYDVSVVEGLFDADVVGGKVDFFAVAKRGCREELCTLDESEMKINLLGFFFDKDYSQWNVVGVVDLSIEQDEILRRRNSGVSGRWESKELNFLRLDLEEVIKYLCSHKIWDMGLATAYFSLVYKLFDRKRINSVIKKYQ